MAFGLRKIKSKKNNNNIWFILGPSGVGKTTFAEYLANHQNWLHLDFDRPRKPRGDNVDRLKMWKQLDNFFFKFKKRPLLRAIRKKVAPLSDATGIVLSFPSDYVASPDHISAISDYVKTFYLYGNRQLCLDAFLDREQTTGRQLGEEYWKEHNRAMYESLDSCGLHPWIVHAFHDNGDVRKSTETLFSEIAARI